MAAKIVKIEKFLPSTIVDSNTLVNEFEDFDVNKVENKIGIKKRHVVSQNETSLDLAYQAANKVLRGYNVNDIDYLILCTQTPDYVLPATACVLQNKLGLSTSTGALDINLGCSGYIYGLALCKGLILAEIASNILLVTADTYTKYLHKKDKGNRSIFGDAATATIISNSEVENLGDFQFGTDGSGYDKLIIKNGGSTNKFNIDAEEKKYGDENIYNDNCIYMNGPEIFNFTIKIIPDLIEKTIEKNNLNEKDVDYYIFHQANKFMLEYLMKKIKIPAKKFFIDMEETGNTVSSTIPIAIHKALNTNKIKKGDKVLLAGFGVGLSWGATIIEI